MADPAGLFDALRKMDACRRSIRGMNEVGLADARRDMDNKGQPASGNEVSRILKAFGFVRDGWKGTGYDRTPRYVWRAKA